MSLAFEVYLTEGFGHLLGVALRTRCWVLGLGSSVRKLLLPEDAGNFELNSTLRSVLKDLVFFQGHSGFQRYGVTLSPV